MRPVNSLLALIKALGEHEAMQRNNEQTYMTPAKDKNAQYFAWDFVRTIVGLLVFSFYLILSMHSIIPCFVFVSSRKSAAALPSAGGGGGMLRLA
jgi:hypothetical protein